MSKHCVLPIYVSFFSYLNILGLEVLNYFDMKKVCSTNSGFSKIEDSVKQCVFKINPQCYDSSRFSKYSGFKLTPSSNSLKDASNVSKFEFQHYLSYELKNPKIVVNNICDNNLEKLFSTVLSKKCCFVLVDEMLKNQGLNVYSRSFSEIKYDGDYVIHDGKHVDVLVDAHVSVVLKKECDRNVLDMRVRNY